MAIGLPHGWYRTGPSRYELHMYGVLMGTVTGAFDIGVWKVSDCDSVFDSRDAAAEFLLDRSGIPQRWRAA